MELNNLPAMIVLNKTFIVETPSVIITIDGLLHLFHQESYLLNPLMEHLSLMVQDIKPVPTLSETFLRELEAETGMRSQQGELGVILDPDHSIVLGALLIRYQRLRITGEALAQEVKLLRYLRELGITEAPRTAQIIAILNDVGEFVPNE